MHRPLGTRVHGWTRPAVAHVWSSARVRLVHVPHGAGRCIVVVATHRGALVMMLWCIAAPPVGCCWVALVICIVSQVGALLRPSHRHVTATALVVTLLLLLLGVAVHRGLLAIRGEVLALLLLLLLLLPRDSPALVMCRYQGRLLLLLLLLLGEHVLASTIALLCRGAVEGGLVAGNVAR